MCVLILLRITRAKKSPIALVISGAAGVKVIDREGCIYTCMCVYMRERERAQYLQWSRTVNRGCSGHTGWEDGQAQQAEFQQAGPK